MKRRILTCTALIGLLCISHLSAERNTEPAKQARESRMLMHLLKMDDAELGKLRETVERIEAMSPEERANMRERLGKLQKMEPERRKALRERFEAIPPEAREAMRRRWKEMTPEDRRAWRIKLRGMSPEERAETIREAGLMPPGSVGKRNKEGKGSTHNRSD